MKKVILLAVLLFSFTATITSCREKTTGEKIEDSIEEVGDEIEEGAEEVKEEIEEATDGN